MKVNGVQCNLDPIEFHCMDKKIYIFGIPQKKVGRIGLECHWRWVHDDRNVIFGWTLSLSVFVPSPHKLLSQTGPFFLAHPQEHIPFWSVCSKGINRLVHDFVTSHCFKAVICVMNGSDEHMGGYSFVPQENIPQMSGLWRIIESHRDMLK